MNSQILEEIKKPDIVQVSENKDIERLLYYLESFIYKDLINLVFTRLFSNKFKQKLNHKKLKDLIRLELQKNISDPDFKCALSVMSGIIDHPDLIQSMYVRGQKHADIVKAISLKILINKYDYLNL
jgi:hypothetical protein